MTEKASASSAPLTLMDLLNSRENRVNHQKELLERYVSLNCDAACSDAKSVEKYRSVVLVSMTLNIPGPVKDRPEYRKALETGIHRLKTMMDKDVVLYEEFRPHITGPEGYLVVTGNPLEIKKAAIAAEEADALGRLFDIDVLYADRQVQTKDAAGIPLTLHDIRSISRSQFGEKPRQCLLCGENGKACARSRAHSMDALLNKINEILSDAGL